MTKDRGREGGGREGRRENPPHPVSFTGVSETGRFSPDIPAASTVNELMQILTATPVTFWLPRLDFFLQENKTY